MIPHMTTAIRAVHILDLQTHGYQEDKDPQRIAVARTLAAQLLLALDGEASRIGLDNDLDQALTLAKKIKKSKRLDKSK